MTAPATTASEPARQTTTPTSIPTVRCAATAKPTDIAVISRPSARCTRGSTRTGRDSSSANHVASAASGSRYQTMPNHDGGPSRYSSATDATSSARRNPDSSLRSKRSHGSNPLTNTAAAPAATSRRRTLFTGCPPRLARARPARRSTPRAS